MAFGYSAVTGDLETFAARNGRRLVFYAVPGGAAPLTGLLSLAEAEDTDGPEFSWTEQRFAEKLGTTKSWDGIVLPWRDMTDGTAANPSVTAAGDSIKVWMSTNENINNWVIGERIVIQSVLVTGATYTDVHGTITAVGSGADAENTYITFTADAALSIVNALATVGNQIMSLGLPNAEGSISGNSRKPNWPIDIYNYTEIFRKKFGFSRTALNQPMFFDKNGKYQTDARDASVAHMIEIENALIWGQRGKATETDADGSPTIRRRMGGVLWYLAQYEASGGGTFGYRPGGTAATLSSDDNKLIIDGGGTISYADWQLFEERMFRTTMTSSYEKLLLGGSTFIAAFLKHYESRVQIHRTMMDDQKLTFSFATVETRHGIIHVKSHPRFNALSSLRKNGLVLDLANLKFRPMKGADTHLREEIQENDFDGRKDEYLTEGSLEMRFPESCMYFKNVSTISTS